MNSRILSGSMARGVAMLEGVLTRSCSTYIWFTQASRTWVTQASRTVSGQITLGQLPGNMNSRILSGSMARGVAMLDYSYLTLDHPGSHRLRELCLAQLPFVELLGNMSPRTLSGSIARGGAMLDYSHLALDHPGTWETRVYMTPPLHARFDLHERCRRDHAHG